MRMIRSALLPALVLSIGLLAVAPAWAAGMTLSGSPKVAFFAQGSPGFLDIEGDSNTVQVADSGTALTFTVPMTSVKTGIGLRDDHMNNEFVEVSKFPNAVLTVKNADVKWPVNVGEAAQGTVTGTFDIHGVPAPTQVTYTVKKTKTGFHVTAKFPFDVSQHGIKVPSYMGVTVAPAMHAEVTLDLLAGA